MIDLKKYIFLNKKEKKTYTHTANLSLFCTYPNPEIFYFCRFSAATKRRKKKQLCVKKLYNRTIQFFVVVLSLVCCTYTIYRVGVYICIPKIHTIKPRFWYCIFIIHFFFVLCRAQKLKDHLQGKKKQLLCVIFSSNI